MILLTAAACMAICYLRNNKHLPGYSGNSYKLVEGAGNCGAGPVAPDEDDDVVGLYEGLTNDEPDNNDNKQPVGQDVIRQLPASMGPFDGLCLQTGNKEYWMKSPDNTSLIPNDSLFSYLSSQGPEKPVFTDNSALFGPTIDGQEGSPKKLFMFANNRTSPNCCPGTFSTSTGCVCTTENQRNFIASRGNQGSAFL